MIRHLTLHMTDACNLECQNCHVAAKCNGYNPCGIIGDSDLMKLFPDSVFSVSLAGGEPFLDKRRLYHLLDIIPPKVQSIAVTTNGTLLNDKDFEILKSRSIRLQFSVDGNKIEHEANRGMHTYDILQENISKAIKNGIRVDLLTTVGKSNVNSIIQYVKENDKKGIDNLTLLHFTPKGRGERHSSEELDDIFWFIFVNSIRNQLHNKYTRVWIQPRLLTEKMIVECNSVRNITFCNCFEPKYAYIDLTTGKVYPCGLSLRTPLCFGNICDPTMRTINEVVRNNMMFKIPSDCIKCQNVLSCKGGAKCYAWLESQNYNAKDPHCRNNFLLPICPFPAMMVSGPLMRTKQPTIV